MLHGLLRSGIAGNMLALTIWSVPAFAQTEQVDAGDVVVTARKRAEQAVDVPVSLGVYD